MIAIAFGYLPVALGLSVWIALIGGLISVALLVRFVGKRVDL